MMYSSAEIAQNRIADDGLAYHKHCNAWPAILVALGLLVLFNFCVDVHVTKTHAQKSGPVPCGVI